MGIILLFFVFVTPTAISGYGVCNLGFSGYDREACCALLGWPETFEACIVRASRGSCCGCHPEYPDCNGVTPTFTPEPTSSPTPTLTPGPTNTELPKLTSALDFTPTVESTPTITPTAIITVAYPTRTPLPGPTVNSPTVVVPIPVPPPVFLPETGGRETTVFVLMVLFLIGVAGLAATEK
jgi:hypothetical protein